MRKYWRLIDSKSSDAAVNMATDEAIASQVTSGHSPPTVRFYSWKRPSVSIGCFQKLSDINIEKCKEQSIPVVRRPTGGRAILHCSEITYSFSAQSTDHDEFKNLINTYRAISDVFFNAFKDMGLDVKSRRRREKGHILTRKPNCFNSVSFGELVLKGHKVIGSAQKRYRNGFLQQGSIPLFIDKGLYLLIFGNGKEPVGLSDLGSHIDGDKLKGSIKDAFEEVFEMELINERLTEDESRLARKLLDEKFRSPDWIHRR